MLDRLIRDRLATRRDIRRVVTRLARFYRDSEPLAVAGAAYRDGFARGIDDNARELSRPRFDLSVERVAALASRQSNLLERQPGLFDARASAGRIVEAHGDLRPEHICLEDDVEPQIIDCLEFSRALRMLDAADELAFLALECERLGAPAFAATIFDTYAEVAGDAPPPPLLAFYRSYRAFVRAKLAIRHLDDPLPRDPAKWIAHARSYLELAWRHATRIG
jgi:aminoglycoside phosphotransferase family enzyme